MMIRRLAGALSFVMAGGLIAVADTPPVQEKTTTLTGCLRTGSASTVYILRGAALPDVSTPGHDAGPMPEDYIVVSVPNNTNLADVVNHRLEMTAVVTEPDAPPAAPPNANAAERALRRLSVRAVKDVAPNCAR
jgi:hypothetical protein